MNATNSNGKVHRFTPSSPCPICKGNDRDRRGNGERCHGFMGSDGLFVHCSREEHAGTLPVEPKSLTYAHRLKGPCNCGKEHGPADPPARPSRPKGKGRGDRGPIQATYDYRSADGDLLFQVVRYKSKDFVQRRPTGKGGWEWNLDGVEKVPYRLPELVAADVEAPVWIAEGEKDVEALQALGLVATCNPGGAGKWRDEFSPYLAGRHVVIIPDHDKPGYDHAAAVARSVKPHAASVKVLDLAGACKSLNRGELPERGDVSDFLAMGGTADDLDFILGQTGEWVDPDDDPPITAGELLRGVASDPWYWDHWIGQANLTGLAASEGVGKTRLLLDLCRRAYRGDPAPDARPWTFPKGTTSLWICSDGHHEELAREAEKMGLLQAILFNGSKEQPYGFTDLDEPETIVRLERNIARARPGLVILDTLTNATSRNLGDQADVKLLMTPLKDMAIKYRVAFILSMHLNRDGNVLGRRLRGWCRTVLKLECPDEEQPGRLRLDMFKTYAKRPDPIGVNLGDDGNTYSADAPGKAKGGRPASEIAEAREAIVGALRRQNDQAGSNLADMVEARGIASSRTGWRAINALVADGRATIDESARPKIVHLIEGEEEGGTDGPF